MRTKRHFKLFTALILLPFVALANHGDWKGKYTKEKTLHKSYNVNRDATVKIDNSYGNIDIITWDENRVVIDVTITVKGNNSTKVQEKLDDIDVEFNESYNRISAKTRFNKSTSWWNWSNNNVSMKINYVIKMPITNHVYLENNYGNINLDKLEGRADINCDYGTITTKELMAENNNLNFDYTKNCYFEYLKSATINADYSGFTVGKANTLNINADYSKSKVEIAENVNYNCDYGSIAITNANTVTGDGNYLSTRLGTIYKNIDIEGDYGALKINNMTANSGDITINSDYMKITIGYSPSYHFNFVINLEYASLRDTDGFEFHKKIIKSTEKYYTGYYGNVSTSNRIQINSDYGSVTFKKN
ncbi:MAG: hypothetical protein HRT67_11990 [Flavobacteriaceae bacterium]|nr:hypothetical protein [Flavobacteriaceae bacterium]